MSTRFWYEPSVFREVSRPFWASVESLRAAVTMPRCLSYSIWALCIASDDFSASVLSFLY
ncbi:Uncharacterised protein [Mycobacteroides abscessus subsp. abscessus]|nr:Uncharacterised protein [Mycobacteroides abscessus subsp. abscessus]